MYTRVSLAASDTGSSVSYDHFNAHNMDVCPGEVSDSGGSTDVCRGLALTREPRKTTISLVVSAHLFVCMEYCDYHGIDF